MAPSRVNIYFRIFCGRLWESEVLRLCGFLFCGKCRTFKGKISVQDFDCDFGGMFFLERGWGRSNIWRKKSLILIFLRDDVGALQMGSVQKSRWGRMCAIFPIWMLQLPHDDGMRRKLHGDSTEAADSLKICDERHTIKSMRQKRAVKGVWAES